MSDRWSDYLKYLADQPRKPRCFFCEESAEDMKEVGNKNVCPSCAKALAEAMDEAEEINPSTPLLEEWAWEDSEYDRRREEERKAREVQRRI